MNFLVLILVLLLFECNLVHLHTRYHYSVVCTVMTWIIENGNLRSSVYHLTYIHVHVEFFFLPSLKWVGVHVHVHVEVLDFVETFKHFL